jgi:DnaJ-class molecular chaperone
MSERVSCPACHGLGCTSPVPSEFNRPCPDCNGEGHVVPKEGSQLARALEVASRIREQAKPLRELAVELQRILDEAQNPPPEGMADGSITVRFFNNLRALERRFQ